MAVIAKRTVISLFSDETIYSHQVRIVLAEKGVTAEFFPVKQNAMPKELLEINPYQMVPTLIDRELVLWDTQIIMEYLDERFPHPPLLPVYPVGRAEVRKMIFRIRRDWYPLLHAIEADNGSEAEEARTELRDSLIQIAPIFANKPFFLSEEFSLLDCCIAPLLWRLPKLQIELPASAKAVLEYGKRMFARDSFQTSLTERERDQAVA